MVNRKLSGSRIRTIIYWVATGWLVLGMLSTAAVQLLQLEEEKIMMARLGYPLYFLTVIGVWKILGVIAILMPRFAVVKEWAYAGFFFIMSGAIVSHIASGDAAKESFGPFLLLVLTFLSWYFRPADRTLILFNQNKLA